MINIATRKTGVRDLVSVSGSILAGRRFYAGNHMAPDIMIALLLSGTKTRNKKSLNDTLENAAISISFGVSADYLSFNTTVPAGKEKLFLEVITDVLANSIFPKDEFAIVVERIRARILQAGTDPDDVAWRALTRAWFPEGSIQHKLSAEARLALLDTLKLEDVVMCHKTLIGNSEINIAVAGDVDKNLWQTEGQKYLGSLQKRSHKIISATDTLTQKSEGEVVNIKDKTSVSVYMATPVNLDVNAPEYRALKCVLRVLGGDFISRLMAEVRVRRGLTYHIGAGIQGLSHGDTGLMYIDASFAPSLHTKGVQATEDVLSTFINKGIREVELKRVRDAIAGEYEVHLATSHGMASEMLNCLELGRPLSYIEEFPKLIQSVTMKEVKGLIAMLKDKKFYRVSAGSI